MAEFFGNIEMDVALSLERLSRLSFELREARAGLLRYHGVADEAALRDRIVTGAIAEHPGWEHLLAARILDDTREATRKLMAGGGRGQVDVLHPALKACIDEKFAASLAAPVTMTQDALVVRLANGVELTLHYAAPDAYSLWWHAGDATVRAGIDTAPVHPQFAPATNHMHTGDGRLVADTITRVGAAPADNVQALLAALIVDPRLGLQDNNTE